MRKQRKIDRNTDGTGKEKFKGDPLTGVMREEDAVRFLIHKGAFLDARVTDSEFIDTLNKGKLGDNWRIVKKSEFSQPRVIGIVDVEGTGSVKISMELSAGRFKEFIFGTLLRAGLPEEFVMKVAKVEKAMHDGDILLVDKLCNFELYDVGPAMGGIEDAFIRKNKEEKEK